MNWNRTTGTDAPPRSSLAEVAVLAARRAAEVLLDWQGRVTIREKSRFDLLTEADEAAQAAILAVVRSYFPEHHFLGEEGAGTARPLDASWTWIVDPLDGTTNYAHQIPLFATSIAVAHHGEPVVGVVLDPVRDELFLGVQGEGARLNGRTISVSRISSLDGALLTVGFPTQPERHAAMLRSWEHFTARAQSLRRMGSTALNLAYVACGRSEATWSAQAHPWDTAAGILLVREAGGVVSRLTGEPYDFTQLDVLAGNPALHGQVLAGLRACHAA